MLRLAVIALLLANAGYYAYTQGWLRSAGLVTPEQAEPQRLQQQIRPETLKVLRAQGATNNPTPPPAPAAALPPGSWSLEPTPITGRWMIYMGRFDDQDTLDKKRAELRARKVDFDRAGGTLEPGLSLGRFSTEEAAQRGLTALNAQGVRTARVIQERQAATGFILKLPAVTDAQRQQWLATLRPAMAGKTLGSCS